MKHSRSTNEHAKLHQLERNLSLVLRESELRNEKSNEEQNLEEH